MFWRELGFTVIQWIPCPAVAFADDVVEMAYIAGQIRKELQLDILDARKCINDLVFYKLP